ncbi:hypothetical protein [Candidatus Manganitrophus noduliformans]|uniref:Uncharacterized protein n=1 Tax=Candidatus Manganitrophus noduliformans TaxID=2606439 RepID=A0A7X6ICX4_9BACT|nr:hypothetical protein [Candidatus Manganitrophus noduliformans]NKE72970.1 hypothetical protein [Candidatus Manganitrophus noduliformans]
MYKSNKKWIWIGVVIGLLDLGYQLTGFGIFRRGFSSFSIIIAVISYFNLAPGYGLEGFEKLWPLFLLVYFLVYFVVIWFLPFFLLYYRKWFTLALIVPILLYLRFIIELDLLTEYRARFLIPTILAAYIIGLCIDLLYSSVKAILISKSEV